MHFTETLLLWTVWLRQPFEVGWKQQSRSLSHWILSSLLLRVMQKQVSTESLRMICPCQSEMYSVIFFFLYSLSVSIYNNSINTGYKVYKVQKFDEISWQSANGSWTAEVVSCKKQNKKNPSYSCHHDNILQKRLYKYSAILSQNVFQEQNVCSSNCFFFFCWFVFCHFIRMFFRMSLDVSLELLQINNKRKSETDFNEASFLLLCWIFGVNM